MNICHINLARGFSGGESQTLLLIKEQIRLGYNVHVVAKKGSPFACACKSLDCSLHEVRHYLTGHKRSVTNRCCVLHVHEGQAIYWALIQHLLFGIPYIVTRRIDNSFKDKWLSQLAYKKAACLVGVSRAVEQILKAAFPGSRTAVVHDSPVAHPISLEYLKQLQDRYKNKFVVVHAAKLYQHKGFDVTIAAARQLANNKNISFCLLGDGPEHDQLAAESASLSNVELLGHQKEMGAWFQRADIVILPSHTEGMGSVLLEACLASTPVIGTRAGGIPDAIHHEVNGLLIDPASPDQLSNAILRIKDEDALRKRINQLAPTFIAEFSIEHAAGQYRSLYDTL